MNMKRKIQPIEPEEKVKKIVGVCVDGLPFFLFFFSLAVVLAFESLEYASIPGFLSLFVLWFFRDPDRTVPEELDVLVSPADGRVIEVKADQRTPLGPIPMKRISIFLSIFNVHVNRIPISGTVSYLDYNRGLFVSAFREKASLDNEQMRIGIDSSKGRILMVQIAGWIARRIVCRLEEKEKVRVGQRFGLIRFGSRVDVYVPESFEITVRKGERVRGGKSILARPHGESS
ncbi:MAG: phosphatidylserine decarboxylase family protein [Bdellovibrionota bacterium]